MTTIQVEYGRTPAGQLGARIQDTGYLAVPFKEELAVAVFRPKTPISEWENVSPDYRIFENLATEDDFRQLMAEFAEHQEQLIQLDRKDMRSRPSTPWGRAQCATGYAVGIMSLSTAGHGGFHLSPTRNAAMPDALRNDNGWYEEDCEWAKVALAYPDYFTKRELKLAYKTLLNYEPEKWSAFTGKPLLPGMSAAHDQKLFNEKHKDDLIVVSAVTSRTVDGMVECMAAIGGHRSEGQGATKTFLVPRDEYAARGKFGFVVDPARHLAFTPPTQH